MNTSRFKILWELMSKYNFKYEGSISTDVICTICKQLTIEPYSTECGCKFCKKCIKDYLGKERKKCPGSKDMCHTENLKMDDNVSKDNTTANNIAKKIVMCPNEKCSFKIELHSMEAHIRICKMQPMPCPYQSIGCGDNEITGDSISNHLQKEELSHSQLLIDAINNLQNDFNGLSDIKNVNEEMSKLHEESENGKLEIIVLKEESERNKGDIDNQKQYINTLNEHLRNEINELSKEIMSLKVMKKEIEMRLNKELDNMRRDFELLKKKVGEDKSEELKRQFEKQNQELENVKSKATKCLDEVEKMNKNKNEMFLSVIYDLVWTIDDLSKKKGEHFSHTFITNNYKFCLRLWLGTDNLWLFLCVRKGENDDKADWPMRHSITLSIMNQETLRPCWSERYSVDTYDGDISVFNRPNNDNDCRIGNMQISLSDIKSVRGLLLRGAMMVCCSLVPPSR